MSRRQRKIYDNDGTVVTASEDIGTIGNSMNDVFSANDTASIVYKSAGQNTTDNNEMKNISVVDVLDTLAGYAMPDFRFVNTSEKGTCMICGKQTSMYARKLCGDCMKHSGERLYNLAKQAIEDGEKEVKI